MPEFECKIKACKSIWIKRILNSEKLCHFAKIFGLPLTLQEICMFNFDVKYLHDYNSSFYKQVLNCWFNLKDTCDDLKANGIREQYIWFNKDIVVDGKPLLVKKMYDNYN